MNFLAKHRIVQVWVVMLTFLFGVLAPTVSRAIEYRQGLSDSIEICTTSGSKLIKLDSDGKRQSTPAMAGMDHCMYCTTHTDVHALPGPAALVIAALAGRDVYPSLYYSAAVTPHAWSAAYPRAPPARV